MENSSTNEPLVELLYAMEPQLAGGARGGVKAIRELRALFPGHSKAEITKAVRTLLQASRTSVPVLVSRANELLRNPRCEPVEAFAADAKRASVSDLKKVGKSLGIELSGAKAGLVAALAEFVESGGAKRPLSRSEIAEQAAKSYVDEARDLLDRAGDGATDRLLAIVDRAGGDKSLGKDGFAAFAKGLGLSVSGSKTKMRKDLQQFVERLSVTKHQTGF